MPITPETNLQVNIIEEEYQDNTYKIDFINNKITDKIDGIEAVEQTIYCILNTERYEHIIYTWDYGSELRELIGKDRDFVIGDIRRRITEALLQDERIVSIDNFEYEQEKDSINLKFTVITKYGSIPIEKVVNT